MRQWVVAASPLQQRGDDLRIHGRPAAGHPFHRIDELVHVADPVLEQVADALGRAASSCIARPSSTYCESTRTATSGWCSRTCSAAACPRRCASAAGGCRGSPRPAGRPARAATGRRRCRTPPPPRARPRQGSGSSPSRRRTLSSAITIRTGSPPSASCRPPEGSRRGACRRVPRPGRRGRAAQTRIGVGPATSVVDDVTTRVGPSWERLIAGVIRLGVLADVGQALADQVVGGRLDGFGQAAEVVARCRGPPAGWRLRRAAPAPRRVRARSGQPGGCRERRHAAPRARLRPRP